jgi:hypothetical protein
MAKSPIYGRGRNRKHRPDRSTFHAAAANINMRGKKSKPDKCWCCICIDFREDIRAREDAHEIKSYMKGTYDG